MEAFFHIGALATVLSLIILLIYRNRLDRLRGDLAAIFSNMTIRVGLILLAAFLIVTGWLLRQKDDLAPLPAATPSARLAATVPPPLEEGAPRPILPSISEIYKKIGPSVVMVSAYGERKELRGRGSGFFVSTGGDVITNHHVLNGAASGDIKTADGRIYAIQKILAVDPGADLIMVSIGTTGVAVTPLSLQAALPDVGERVVVVGSPFGLEQTVSDGIISAVRETADRGRLLQITAPISPGSSGSPVVNMRAELIGVAFSQLVRGQNLNFCIAADRVRGLSAGSGYPLSSMGQSPGASASKPGRTVYCYLEEGGSVRFTENPANPRYSYTAISAGDGLPDKTRFENWVFAQIGGDPQQLDPQIAVVKAREELPELFKKIFTPQYTLGDLPKLPSEAQIHWQKVVNHHLANAYNEAMQKRNAAILRHRVMMDAFYMYRATLNQP